MFEHKMDPLVRSELNELRTEITNCKDDLAEVEKKLDEVLKALDSPARSTPTDGAKPEPLGVMPGHIPWSQRKRTREQNSRSPQFVDRVVKGAALTEPKEGETEK